MKMRELLCGAAIGAALLAPAPAAAVPMQVDVYGTVTYNYDWDLDYIGQVYDQAFDTLVGMPVFARFTYDTAMPRYTVEPDSARLESGFWALFPADQPNLAGSIAVGPIAATVAGEYRGFAVNERPGVSYTDPERGILTYQVEDDTYTETTWRRTSLSVNAYPDFLLDISLESAFDLLFTPDGAGFDAFGTFGSWTLIRSDGVSRLLDTYIVFSIERIVATRLDGTDPGDPGDPGGPGVPAPVPLPASVFLMFAGLGGLAALRRRRT